MPLAHLLGYGDPRLANIFGTAPKIRPEHVAILGARSYEEEERELLEKLKVAEHTRQPVRFSDQTLGTGILYGRNHPARNPCNSQ